MNIYIVNEKCEALEPQNICPGQLLESKGECVCESMSRTVIGAVKRLFESEDTRREFEEWKQARALRKAGGV